MLLEAGTASGREPSAVVELRSYLGQYLDEKKLSLGAEDEGGFSLRLLHFRRTFVEKMFAIHSKVELLKRDRQASVATPATTMTCFNCPGTRKSRPCSARSNTPRLRRTTTRSVDRISPRAISSRKA